MALVAWCTTSHAQQLIIVQADNFDFVPRDITINPGDTVVWENVAGSHNVNGSLEDYPSNPEGFFSGPPMAAPGILDTVVFTVPGVYDYHCDPHLALDMVGTVTVTSGFPVFAIATVTTVDADGIADSLGVAVEVRGIVHGNNIRPGGIQFTMIDAAGDGIGTFLSDENFGYEAAEGDEVTVRGTIDQFRGLTQVEIDTVILESQGNAIVEPVVVTELNESTESQLITIRNVTIVDPAQWTNESTGFNVDIEDDQGRTFVMRVDADVDLFGTPAPAGRFDLTGIGGQFDQEEPLLEGYEIAPRFLSDLEIVSSTQEPAWASELRLAPNPVSSTLRVALPNQAQYLRLLDVHGRTLRDLPVRNTTEALDLSLLPAGLYYLQVSSKDDLIIRKIQKQ